MNAGKISVRYAQALYALAEEKGLQQEVYTSMEQLSNAFIEVTGLANTLSNPMHSASEKFELLVTASGCTGESLLATFFRFVISKGREEFLVFIAMSYQKIYREKERIVTGKITSALPLGNTSLVKIRQLVRERYDASIELSTEVKPDIIGGFILEVDNYRMDSSIQNRLDQIRNGLLHE